MTPKRKLLLDICAGTLLSCLFGGVLVYQLMGGGVGTSISFLEFLYYPENVIFTLLMCSFVFASWVMRGPNNRMVIFCWALAILTYQIIVWATYHYYYYQYLNIYILNLVGVAGTIPAVLFLRYRLSYSILLLEKLRSLGVFTKEIDHYLEDASTTDFEFYMKQTMYVVFFIEYAYSSYQTFYALYYQIPHHGSIYEHILQHNHWDPFELYTLLKNLIGSIYILIIGIYLFRDNKQHDAFAYGASDKEKRAISLQMLEKQRAKARKNNDKNQ